jgi:pilus assembly protein FimV
VDCLRAKVKILGIALLLAASSSIALTLGRLRGAALVGLPLDVAVQVQLGEGEDAAALCFEAEVFHADTRQEASRVRVQTGALAPDRTLNVRVVSSVPVDEPVVSVQLRAGCASQTNRRYVLLADVPVSVVAASAAPLVPPVRLAPLPLAPGSADTKPAVKTQTVPSKPASKSVVVPPPQSKVLAPVKSQRPAGQARLKLDPLDLFSDRLASLDSFMNFEPPEDALLRTQQLLAMESKLKANQALAAKTEASLLDLRQRLEKAESEHVSAVWLYGLAALALAGLGGAFYLLYRQRPGKSEHGDWMSGSVDGSAFAPLDPVTQAATLSGVDYGELDFTLPPDAPEAIASGLGPHVPGISEVDVHLVDMSDSKFDTFMTTGAGGLEHFQPLAPMSSKATGQSKDVLLNFNTDAIQDIRQQAEFFVSLGQSDRAMSILKKKIDLGGHANPFVYLDLLGIHHSLNQKVDFETLRVEFNSVFRGVVPAFSMFRDEGNGLEFYPEALDRIAELWSTPEGLQLMESFIFQDSRHPQNCSFALAAFRDLLLLHGVAQSLALPQSSEDPPTPSMAPTRPASQRVSEFDLAEVPPTKAVAPLAAQATSVDLELDLDLDLSDAIPDSDSSKVNPDTALDFSFSLLMPEGQANSKAGNLIDFDLPTTPR